MEAEDVQELGELLPLEKVGQQLSLHGRDVALVNQDAVNFSQAAKRIAANSRIALPIRPRTRSTDVERTIETRWLEWKLRITSSTYLLNGALMRGNVVTSESTSGEKISDAAIREVLSRILGSAMFIQSDRLSRFLRFTVEATLAGEAGMLKEYLIGTEVYGRKPPYHPNTDSIVRSEARRLRNKLREYYESAGKDEPVFIYYRPGSYVPAFRHARNLRDDRIATDLALGELLTEELGPHALEVPFVDRKVDVQIVLEGTVRLLRLGSKSSTPTDFRPDQNGSKRNQIRKVVSMSLRKPHRR